MAFTIVADWWEYLSRRAGTEAALKLQAPGDTEANHPLVVEAAQFAIDSVRNALEQKYSASSIDALDPTKVDAEMRLHAGSLALFALNIKATGRPPSVDDDYDRANAWLASVRKGTFHIGEVSEGAAVAADARGAGHVRYRSRKRQVDRSDPDSEYNLRNPRI